MKFLKYLLPVALACGLATSAFAHYNSGCDDRNERDFEGIYDFIKSKRQIPFAKKIEDNDFKISGDIRADWSAIREKKDGVSQRGSGSGALGAVAVAPAAQVPPNGPSIGIPLPTNEFDIAFNLMIDYKGPCTWGVVQLQYENNMGLDVNPRDCYGYNILWDDPTTVPTTLVNYHVTGDPKGVHGSGTCDNFCLRKAYFGYNIYDDQCGGRLDIEIGRRHFYDVFESRVHFGERFDGVLFRYSNTFQCVGDFYVNSGPFIIDENVNHWGWVLETGLLNIGDCGFDIKYSYVDWDKKGHNRCGELHPVGMEHRISHFYLAYNFNPEFVCTHAKIYGAVLYNHAARARPTPLAGGDPNEVTEIGFDGRKENIGFYIGFNVGQIRQEGDWFFDLNYQYIKAGLIPDTDVTGITHGNAHCIPVTVNSQYGNGNYRGFRAEAIYALTDNLTLHPSFEYAKQLTSDIPLAAHAPVAGSNLKWTYCKFQFQVVYAF